MAGDAAPTAAAFNWIRDSVIAAAGCVTLASPANPRTIAEAFGGRPEEMRRLPLSRIGSVFQDSPAVAFRVIGGWVLAVEQNGWQGSRPEVLRRIPGDGRTVSAYWNVNGMSRFSYAAGGRVLTAFDATWPDRREGDDPDSLEQAMAGLPWPSGDLVPAMLALAARVTGETIQPEWLEGEFDVLPVQPWADDVPTLIYPDAEPLTYVDPALAWALRHADAAGMRASARIAVAHALASAGAAGHPAIIRALHTTPPGRTGELDELARQILARPRGRSTDRPPRSWHFAVEALREATSPMPLAAAFKAISSARSALQATHGSLPEMRAEIMHALGDPAPPSGSLGLTALTDGSPAERYMWITAHWLAPLGSIAFVRDLALDEVASRLGGNPARSRMAVPALAGMEVALGQEGPWAVAVAAGSIRPGDFAELSAGTTVVIVRWEARSRALLWSLVDGEIRAQVDPQRPEHLSRYPSHGLVDHLGGLPMSIPDATPVQHVPVLLALAQRITGVSLMPEWLDAPRLIVPLQRGAQH